MKMSKNGLQLLQQWEGSKAKVYRDSAGLPTIGVGHLLTRSELTSGKILIGSNLVRYADGLNSKEILDLLGQDLLPAEAVVSEKVTVNLNQNQFDALVSFAFNVGGGAFKNSTLLKLLNSGEYSSATKQFFRWVYAGGRIVKGLVKRRGREAELFIKT